MAPWRVLIAVGLVGLVAALTHLGPLFFAAVSVAFIAVAAAVLVFGLFAAPSMPGPSGAGGEQGSPGQGILAVVMAFPVAMALATGVEAPSTAIAELGELDGGGRRRFGQTTLLLTLGVVGTLTMALAAEVAHWASGRGRARAPRSPNLPAMPPRLLSSRASSW